MKKLLSRTALAGLCLLVGLFSFGCLETGLGDPEQAKADSRINGVWMGTDAGEYLLVRGWDARTHIISSVSAVQVDGKTQYKVGQAYKAWLATVDGVTYITIDYQPTSGTELKQRYGVAKMVIQENTIESATLNEDLVKGAKTSDELIKLIREKKDEPKLFSAPNQYKRAPADVAAAIN